MAETASHFTPNFDIFFQQCCAVVHSKFPLWLRWCERDKKREGTVQTTGALFKDAGSSTIEQIALPGLVSADKNTTHTFRAPEITVSLYYVR